MSVGHHLQRSVGGYLGTMRSGVDDGLDVGRGAVDVSYKAHGSATAAGRLLILLWYRLLLATNRTFCELVVVGLVLSARGVVPDGSDFEVERCGRGPGGVGLGDVVALGISRKTCVVCPCRCFASPKNFLSFLRLFCVQADLSRPSEFVSRRQEPTGTLGRAGHAMPHFCELLLQLAETLGVSIFDVVRETEDQSRLSLEDGLAADLDVGAY